MTSILVTWVDGVVAYLQAQFTTADVRVGEPDPENSQNQRDNDLICVWMPGFDELQRDIGLATPSLTVRWYPAKSRKQGRAHNPDDPRTLYQIAEDLMVAMNEKRRFGDFADRVACHVSACKPVTQPEGNWYVEATVLGVSKNLAVDSA